MAVKMNIFNFRKIIPIFIISICIIYLYSISITFSATNNPPTDIILSNNSIDETSSTIVLIGELSTLDADTGDTHTYSFITGNGTNDADNDKFSIDNTGDTLTLNQAVDYETQSSYSIFIRTDDGNGGTYDETLEITVNDINEAPIIDDQVFSLDENKPNGSVVGTVIANDSDSSSTLIYTLTHQSVVNAFEINSNNGELQVKDNTGLDNETTESVNLQIQVTDSGNLADTGNIIVNLNDINDAPYLSDATVYLDENSEENTLIKDLDATDQDGNTLTYSITDQSVSNAFKINSTTGELKVYDEDKINYEANQEITATITVTDDGIDMLSDTAEITVKLKDVNENPIIETQTFTIDENQEENTVVATIEASDSDSGDVLKYSIIDESIDNAFEIDSNTGEVKIKNETKINHEANNVINITVKVEDNADTPLSDNAIIIFVIDDINDAPTIYDTSFDLVKDAKDNDSVGTLIAIDEDGDDIEYTMIDQSITGAFTIDDESGKIRVADEGKIDNKSKHVLTINVSDDASPPLSKEIDVTINIIDDISFPDIENTTFEEYIKNLALNDIISGYSNGYFYPDAHVTRGQMAKFIVNAFEINIDTSTSGGEFPDVQKGVHNLYDYIQTLKNKNIIGGYSDGTFRPDVFITREEITKFIVNAINETGKDSADITGTTDKFPDISSTNKFIGYITYISNLEIEGESIMKGYSNGYFGPKDRLTRGQLSKIVDLARRVQS